MQQQTAVPECPKCKVPMVPHSTEQVGGGGIVTVFSCSGCGRLAAAETAMTRRPDAPAH